MQAGSLVFYCHCSGYDHLYTRCQPAGVAPANDRVKIDALACFPAMANTSTERMANSTSNVWHVIPNPNGQQPTDAWGEAGEVARDYPNSDQTDVRRTQCLLTMLILFHWVEQVRAEVIAGEPNGGTVTIN
jgi:hypothetical protein